VLVRYPFFCPWNDRVPDGNRGGKGRRKESEDEIWGRWGCRDKREDKLNLTVENSCIVYVKGVF